MNVRGLPNGNERGFTLLEVIITLIVASILGAMLVQLMGTSVIQSAKPVIMVQEGFRLNQVIEKMTVDYKKLIKGDADPLETLKGRVGSEGSQQSIPGNPYGNYYVVQNSYIKFNEDNEETPDSAEKRILKATIARGEQSLTALFTK